MKKLSRYSILLFCIALVIVSACATKDKITSDGYRYVSFQIVPRDKTGKLTEKAFWNDKTNYVDGLIADSFYVYGSYDSIRMKAPVLPPDIFRKTNIRAESWKAKPSYGNLYFVGDYTTKNLPGAYVSFYFSKDRNCILQALYTNPGTLVDAVLFHKDSVNILKKQGIVVEPSQ